MKKYSSIRSVQLVAHLLQEYQIDNVVISPGSRNAPLAIQFGETEYFNSYSIVDERSAAFVALGMAKSVKKPVAITCTSGSASVNYYPAITEAFYQNVPLIILTADRPKDYVDLFDGQTIRQNGLYSQHSYGDFQLKEDHEEESEQYNIETIKKAIEVCIEKSGPVHINIPLSEPLYELTTELPNFPSVENTIHQKNFTISPALSRSWNDSKRIMILVGNQDLSPELEAQLSQLVKNHSVVVLTEANSNVSHPKFFSHIDRYIFNFDQQDYQTYAPDLLITLGQNIVSKKVKAFLRNAYIKEHWHVDPFWHPDTYFALSEKIYTTPQDFLAQLLPIVKLEPSPYFNLWNNLKEKKDQLHNQYVSRIGFSDFHLFNLLSKYIPENFTLFFSNSSAIRYAQLFSYKAKEIYCNRGTSGIEGCTSTAMGYAIKSENPTVLVTGDLGFFYDINGLWNPYIPPYTRIIIFNNAEGNIFKIIPGPDQASENILEEFIATKHDLKAKDLAKHFKMEYILVENDETIERVLENFFSPSERPKILEVSTKDIPNEVIQRNYFKFLSGKGVTNPWEVES